MLTLGGLYAWTAITVVYALIMAAGLVGASALLWSAVMLVRASERPTASPGVLLRAPEITPLGPVLVGGLWLGFLFYLRSGEECLSEQSLASLEETLDNATFVRAHRKSIVRLDAVRSVGVGPNPRIELVTGLSVPLARSKRRAFVDRIRTEPR
jgi:hypothetical protein